MPASKLPQTIPSDISQYFFLRFASGNADIGDEWYRFDKIESIPTCLKHDFPTRELEFRVPPICLDFKIMTVNLQDALNTLPSSERLNLNPARWSNVKRDLSRGWCFTPWIGIEDGRARLTDGRHRIVAMLKFLQLEYATFSVNPDDFKAVQDQIRTRQES